MDTFGHIGVSFEDQGIDLLNENNETDSRDFLSLNVENENFVPENDHDNNNDDDEDNKNVTILAENDAIKKFASFFKSNFKNMVVYKFLYLSFLYKFFILYTSNF